MYPQNFHRRMIIANNNVSVIPLWGNDRVLNWGWIDACASLHVVLVLGQDFYPE